MRERKLAADIANYIGVAVTNYLKTEEHKTLVTSRDYLKKRFIETQNKLGEVEQKYIEFKERNYVQRSPKLFGELIRHERRFKIAQDVYVMISKQLELMLLEEKRIKPVVAILDTAATSYRHVYPKKKYIVILNTFSVFFLSILFFALKNKYYTNEMKDKIKKIYEKR